jgi:glycerophosphoryl diester phosphodiesterase
MKVWALLLTLAVAARSAAGTEACAHRGDMKVAPENTIPALVSAVAKGAAQIEFDVQLSKDGHLVLMHDATVDRTTNGTGKVGDLTFAELRALDAGSWFDVAFAGTRIPTLREALEVIPEDILCNVHLKDSPGVAAAAAREIAALGRLEQCFLACTLEQAKEAKAAVPAMRICNMSRQGDLEAYVASTIESGAEFIQLHRSSRPDDLAGVVRRLHDAGVTVNYFGADDPPTIRALAAAGIDYILTDDLDTCLQTLAALRSVENTGAGAP